MDAIAECMNMIAYGGEAKGHALEAINQAKEGDFAACEESLKLSDEALTKSHQAHTNLLFYDAQNQDLQVTILMVHAADHLGSAETIRTLADEIIYLIKEVKHV
ncbi:MAG: PTS lactose/cellobiose transporter subunit IIA [Erysipelotrichaceae bacterium]|nr:PTS lactose/cellobiose transporter subunit IIA [Erysipelotrichaceae bacterium]